MVSEVISKAGKPNIKVNAKYYSNALLKKIFLKWTDRQNIMSIYSCKTDLELTQPSPSLKCWITRNNFHYRSHIICLWINYIWDQWIWDLGTPGATCKPRPKDNQSRFFERVIVEKWNKIPPESIDKCIDASKTWLRRLTEIEDRRTYRVINDYIYIYI